ncbi:adenylate/guanylate cyclase domain-containing protein [uncultured Psychroserpens sp.]|uniref:adenylate/guanylate cyclase domain-containing protein n=1 Tax=uncultured Psychroserpens sp. TaxID=255436 RepID=UPI00261B3DCF|nr:adenylate/guanylate cyclase domain-containing protein [uncultured Psychroserpens sp.]
MKYNLFKFLKLLVFTVFFWSFASTLFIVIRFFAYGEEQGATYVNPKNIIPITEWLDFGLILGIIIGIFYAIVEFSFEKYISQKLNLAVSIGLKLIIYLTILIISLSFITLIAEDRMDIDLNNEQGWWRTDPLFWLSTAYFLLTSLVFSFIRIANDKLGSGVFIKMLLGKYRKPQEEKRILMFLDLKDSTAIAEKLGHKHYSQFIQDCFFDLNTILRRYDAEVYQYVGDEAVISWRYKKGVKNNNCIDLFYAFQNALLKRSKYYQKSYGLNPLFKAGLHGGQLMVAEVGTIKKEIAYHGDVINTTSRIQSECNTYNENLLISNGLLDTIDLKSKYKSRTLGEIQLKGKQEIIEISAIQVV